MTEQKDEKSNTKNNNPKIGRPAKTDQEQQFKNHYLQNRKKFELECELLVYIHQVFFDDIATHPTNQRVGVQELVQLFEMYDCMKIYQTLTKLNEHYYKSSSLFPQQKLRYTSLIDVSYMMRQIKLDHGNLINSYELILLVFFFLFNQKVVNAPFLEYFQQKVEFFRYGMINGLNNIDFTKMDTLIVALALEVAIREGMLIEQEVEDEQQQVMKVEPNSPAPQQMKVYPAQNSFSQESNENNEMQVQEENNSAELQSISS